MRRSARQPGRMSLQEAEVLGAQALAFLAEDPARLQRFLSATGQELGELRARAGEAELLAAVLAHLAEDESLLLVFAASRQVAAQSIAHALALLQEPQL